MPKCDTKDTDKKLLMDDGIRDRWCRACYKEFMLSDDANPRASRCRACEVIHLRAKMYEKSEGHHCRACAAEYEKNLLDKMTRKEETTCSGS